jgi:hypothetical protein
MESDNQREFNFTKKNPDKCVMPVNLWMTEEEIRLIKSYLGKDKNFFEWGAGGSTIEFSKYVKEYYSVEHDFDWYNIVFKNVGKNVHLFYIPPNTPDLEWFPPFEEGKASDFKSYIKFVHKIVSSGKKFDLVLVDGRARVDCALEVLPYLQEKAVVFIHDFEREYYWKVLKYYEIVSIVDKLAVLRIKKELLNNDKIFLMKRFLMEKLYVS